MKFLLVFFVVSIGAAVADSNVTEWTDEMIQELFDNADADELSASTPELIIRNNYTAEVHHVTTEDGYLLEMHRIPASPTSPAADDKPVVFLMHGLLCSSADWIVIGPEKSLGYILADAGYDVWMGNARGNTYSNNHSSTISEKEFWDFSWNEIGYYDLPAMIDYALEKTGQQQVIYMGHSQGTTTFYVLMTLRPEYNAKIKVMFSLAPIAYVGNMFNPFLQALSVGTDIIEAGADLLGVYSISPSPSFISEARALYCAADVLSQFLCSNIIFLIGGYDKAQLNVSTIPMIFGHFPAGSSLGQLVHYSQEIQSHKFRKYDYGSIENMLKYGSLTPPNYNLSLITAPVHLVYSGNDWLSAVKDVTQLYNELGNPIEMCRVPYDTWAHFDYLWGIDARELVYEPIIDTLERNYSSP